MKKLFARYRQFKHRRINNLVTFKVPRATIERITQYAFQLGYPESANPCLVDILHFLSDPIEMHELTGETPRVILKNISIIKNISLSCECNQFNWRFAANKVSRALI